MNVSLVILTIRSTDDRSMQSYITVVYFARSMFSIVTKAPGRAAATGREECVRASENESPRRFLSAVSSVYSTRSNMHFGTTGSQQSYVRSLQCHCYTESSLLETAKQPDAALVCSLSYRDARARNSNSKTRTRSRSE